MPRYEHGGDIYGNTGVLLDFSVNINPLGMPSAVKNALISRTNEFTNYPDPECRKLRCAIATKLDLPVDWITCGNGAADLIYRLCYAVKPKNAMVCAPTFSEYEKALEQTGSNIIYHLLKEENGFDITEDLLDDITCDLDMLFLCHPNNPTGRLINDDLMERIMIRANQTGTIVVVDECFLDFTNGASTKRFLSKMHGLCVLNAFTKIYAIAGLRLGYMLSSDTALLCKINSAAQCWSVSVPAQIAGTAALSCEGWVEKTLSLVTEERRYLTKHLKNSGIKVYSGDANYLLIRSQHSLYEMLLEKGILIRRCGNFKGLDDTYFRLGVKTRNENDVLIKTLWDFLK